MPGWDPVELEGPEWLNGEKARDDPEAGQERRLRGKSSFVFLKVHCSAGVCRIGTIVAKAGNDEGGGLV